MRGLFKGLARAKKKKKKADEDESEQNPPGDVESLPGTPAEPAIPSSDDVGPLVIVDKISNSGTDEISNSGTDVVFVHGLRGSRLNTWSKDGVCWPRDWLCDDLEDIRVIAWGYDASIAHAFQFASKESIFGHAETLLDDLARLRRGVVCPYSLNSIPTFKTQRID